MSKEYISEKQLMHLTAGFLIGTAILLIPTMSIALAGQDAWLPPLLSVLPGIGLIGVLTVLHKMYPGQSLVQYSVSILGLPGKLAGLLVIWFAFHLSTLVLRNIGSFINTVMLFETPAPLVHVVVAAVTAYGIRLGIESIARAFSILMPISVAFFLLMQAFTLPTADFNNLLPILEKGFLPIMQASIDLTAFPVGEIVLFGMIVYHVKTPKEKPGFYWVVGLLLGTLIILLGIIRTISILGPSLSGRNSFAILVALNATGLSKLLQPLLVVNWFVFTVCKFFVCYYAFVMGVAHWAHLDDYKPVILPAGALITVFSLYLYTNVVQEMTFASQIFPVYAIPIEYGIPLLLLVVALLRGGPKKTRQHKKSDSR